MVSPITGKIFSALGSESSLLPLALKDTVDNFGMIAGACITGDKLEGKDRFIDEFGTGAIWLGGVPFFKKVIDTIVFKPLKVDPAIDIRLFKDKKILNAAIKNAHGAVKASLKAARDNEDIVKNLNIGKFAAATAFTFTAYSALTKFRHKYTKDSAEKQVINEHKNRFCINKSVAQKPSFEAFYSGQKQSGRPNFTGFQDFMTGVMTNPVKNTMVVDLGITSERLAKSRNLQDFIGNAIKESGFWLFMYLIQKPLRQRFEQQAANKGKCIALDSKVIESDDLQKFFRAGSPALSELSGVKMYEFLVNKKNSDNILVQTAKKSGIIKTLKDGAVDTRAYIDLDAVKEMRASLGTLYDQYKKAPDKDEFFKELRSLKRAAVLKNIGASVLMFALAVPGMMVAMRYLKKDNKEFKVKEQAEKELAAQGKI